MVIFIVNEASGRGRAGKIWQRMRRALLEMGVPFQDWHTHQPGKATALAALASKQAGETVRLVVVGGDGTVNEVLNGITDFSRVALGVVPIGSGNDFARGLRLPRDPGKALERALSADGSVRIDIGQVTVDGQAPRRFGISASVGMDAWICAEVDASLAKSGLNHCGMGNLTYGFMTLSAAWHLQTARGKVCLTTPQGVYTRSLQELIFMACMNFPWEGGGVPVAPGADARDGYFSVCLAEALSRPQVFRKLPLLALGRHVHTNGVTLLKASRVDVQLETPLYMHADGEVPGRVRRASFEVLPQKLRVLV